jgi:hypothetical protein
MSLSLQILNSDCSLNAFFIYKSFSFIGGEDITFRFRLWQPQKNIRFVVSDTATVTVEFQKSDGTTINKTALAPFSEDKSIWEVTLSDTETSEVISQNLAVKLQDGSNTSYAILQGAIQRTTLTQVC